MPCRQPRGLVSLTGFTKDIEDALRYRVGSRPPFGMPLQTQIEAATHGLRVIMSGLPGEGFDHAVWRPGLDARARRQAIDALAMQAVDHDLAVLEDSLR